MHVFRGLRVNIIKKKHDYAVCFITCACYIMCYIKQKLLNVKVGF